MITVVLTLMHFINNYREYCRETQFKELSALPLLPTECYLLFFLAVRYTVLLELIDS